MQKILKSHSIPFPVLAILGPTACGKTVAALALASRWPIEIVSVDSALVYRGMDIGTAKPTLTEQAICPHHLINILSPEETYSAARFVLEAVNLVEAIRSRNRVPVLVGGTMLYFKALREGLSDLPRADVTVRMQIEADAQRLGWPALHARLAQCDPERAARLSPNDAQRIQRALEIIHATQAPVSRHYARREIPSLREPVAWLALNPRDRDVLHQRIAQRFEAMLEQGFLEEVRTLQQNPRLHLGLPAIRAVGYRQAWEWLQHPTSELDLRDKGIAATRQLAKRQITWIRQFMEHWPDLTCLDCFDEGIEARILDWADQQLAPYLA